MIIPKIGIVMPINPITQREIGTIIIRIGTRGEVMLNVLMLVAGLCLGFMIGEIIKYYAGEY
jgi:hypothetical protein